MKRRILKLLMLKIFWSWPRRDLVNCLLRYQHYMVTRILISMSGTPAAAVYDTLLSCVALVIDYFSYIEVPHFLDEIKMSQLSEKQMEDFFGKLTERTLGKNLRIGDMARRITNCAFTHLFGHIITKEQDAVGVSFRRCRPSAEEICPRWMRLRMIKVSFGCYLTFVMNSCSQPMIFGNVSQHLEKGKRLKKSV